MASRLAVITFLDGQVDNTLPGGGVPTQPIFLPPIAGNLPSYGGGHPSHGLPSPGQPAQLPVFPYDPTHLPSPGDPPVVAHPIVPGRKFIVKWLACVGLILVPDNSLPETEEPEPK